jgi:hypothetical protein
MASNFQIWNSNFAKLNFNIYKEIQSKLEFVYSYTSNLLKIWPEKLTASGRLCVCTNCLRANSISAGMPDQPLRCPIVVKLGQLFSCKSTDSILKYSQFLITNSFKCLNSATLIIRLIMSSVIWSNYIATSTARFIFWWRIVQKCRSVPI